MNFRVITKQDLLSGGRDVKLECFRGEIQAKVLHRDIFLWQFLRRWFTQVFVP